MFNCFRAVKWLFQNAKYARVSGHIIVDFVMFWEIAHIKSELPTMKIELKLVKNILGDFVNLGKFPVGST